jgi:hypothetical protein
MINVRRADGDRGASIFTFEKGAEANANILVLTKNAKGWTLEVPKTTITESSSDMRTIQELAEALSKVAQIVETDGFNLSGMKVLPAKNQPQISTVGTAEKTAAPKKAKKVVTAKKAKPAKN